jgi:flavodoxin
MYEVIYYSIGGNTRKVAEAIAEEVGTKARDIKTVEAVDGKSVIMLGTGCYGAVLVKDIVDFIERNQLQGRKVALFTTSAFGMSKEVEIIENQLKNKGVDVIARFNCGGRWGVIKRNHPDTNELEKAREFARMIMVTKANREPAAV